MTTTTIRPAVGLSKNHLSKSRLTKYQASVPSPLGPLLLEATDAALTNLHLPHGKPTRELPPPAAGEPTAEARVHLEAAARQLGEYFAGERRTFDLELDPAGTAFQRSVWFELAEIPYGHAISYGDLANRVGRPKAFRAVGQANGANPIAIILPCHRVLAANSRLGGYSGGLDTKRRLLAHEAVAYID